MRAAPGTRTRLSVNCGCWSAFAVRIASAVGRCRRSTRWTLCWTNSSNWPGGENTGWKAGIPTPDLAFGADREIDQRHVEQADQRADHPADGGGDAVIHVDSHQRPITGQSNQRKQRERNAEG